MALSSENSEARTQQSTSPWIVGILFALMGTTLFSLKPVLIKIAFQNGLTPEAVIGLRMFIALPFYVVIGVLALRHRNWQASPKLMAMAALTGLLGYYAAAYLDLLALTYISAQLERLVLFTYPGWVIVFAALFLGEAITKRKIFALLLAYIGVILVVVNEAFTVGDGVAIGVGLAFLTTIMYSAYTLASKPLITGLGTGLFTSIAMASSGFMIAAHLAVTDSFGDLVVSTSMLGLVAFLAIGATVAPSYLLSAAVSRVGVGNMAVASTIGPGITSVLAVWILGEAFTVFNAAGLLFTGAGIVVLTWKRAEEKR